MTTDVKSFPGGISPFGCYDMCGNTWELTGNEYSDGRSRFVMLKGGSCYDTSAAGSDWYFDGGPQKNRFIAKMLLIWPGLDRCSTVGFRCARLINLESIFQIILRQSAQILKSN